MTENEAINYLRQINPKHIECVELIDMKEVWENIPQAVPSAEKALREIQQYRAIGTVEECREAIERQIKKKPVKNEYNHDCYSNCGWIVYQDEWGGRYLPHCENCGQAIDWSE